MPPAGTALQRLKDAQRARQQTGATGQGKHLAAASDADNEIYMQTFEQAFSSMSASDPGHLSAAATATNTAAALLPNANRKHSAKDAAPSSSSRQPVTIASRATGSGTQACTAGRSPCLQETRYPEPRSNSSRQEASLSKSSRARVSTNGSDASHVLQEAGGLIDEAGLPAVSKSTAAQPGWRVGPVAAAGTHLQLSDRPLLCSAANWSSNEVVIGSSDHASYVIDAAASKKRRTLYSKTTGHTEWVTSVCCLPGGRVLSGGMDGRLWLWPAAGTAGSEIQAAHAAPISKVACLTSAPPAAAAPPAAGSSGNRSRSSIGARSSAAAAAAGPVLAVSCSYDKTVKVWDVSSSKGKQMAVLQGHAGPVLELAVHPGGKCITTGDRKGGLMCWDLDSGSSSWGAAGAHQGHITALAWSATAGGAAAQEAGSGSSWCLISGGQDGVVRVWDGRTGSCVAEQAVHVDKKGKGAVSNIVTGCGSSGNLVVTTGADMTLRVLDAAQSYRAIQTLQLTDFPYSLAPAAADLVLCGCGDGSVHVVDVEAGVTLYALGAGRAAVRAMEVSPDGRRLVCAGDDGCVVCYEF